MIEENPILKLAGLQKNLRTLLDTVARETIANACVFNSVTAGKFRIIYELPVNICGDLIFDSGNRPRQSKLIDLWTMLEPSTIENKATAQKWIKILRRHADEIEKQWHQK